MINLPKRVKIPKEVLKDKQYDSILDYLSDRFGFCINNFTLKNGYAIKINWDISD